MSIRTTLLTLSGIALVSACQAALPPLEAVDYVDLERFMGDWYVIANIPTFFEKGAHNAVESYHLDDDGTIATTFTFRKDGFGGKEKSYHPRGFVRDTSSNAEWGMQFVWLMARDPEMVDSEYEKAVRFITAAGYDTAQLQRVPQSW